MTTDLTPVLAALTGLPGSAYEVLYRTGSLHVQQVVAANPSTPAALREQCLAHANQVVKKLAAQLVVNPNDFTGRRGHAAQMGFLLNPRTDPELLARTADAGQTYLARAAMMNPATPVESFLHKMTPAHTKDRIGRGNDADRFTRAARILDAHPGLANVCEWWQSPDAAVVRAVGVDPSINVATAKQILDQPGRAGKSALRLNPYVPRFVFGAKASGRGPLGEFADRVPRQPSDLVELAGTPSLTVQLVLAKAACDPDAGIPTDVPATIAARRGPNASAHAYGWAALAAPHRVVPGCGDLAHTHLNAAAEIAPLVLAREWPRRYSRQEIAGPLICDDDVAVLRSLPDSPDLWLTVSRLLTHPEHDVADLIASALVATG